VATLAGVNIPLIAYRHELDLRPSPAGPVDRRVVWQGSWIERMRCQRWCIIRAMQRTLRLCICHPYSRACAGDLAGRIAQGGARQSCKPAPL
jgi:hypothetical protein